MYAKSILGETCITTFFCLCCSSSHLCCRGGFSLEVSNNQKKQLRIFRFRWNNHALNKLTLVLSDVSLVGDLSLPQPTFNKETFVKLFKNRIICIISQEGRLKTYNRAVVLVSTYVVFLVLFFDPRFVALTCMFV